MEIAKLKLIEAIRCAIPLIYNGPAKIKYPIIDDCTTSGRWDDQTSTQTVIALAVQVCQYPYFGQIRQFCKMDPPRVDFACPTQGRSQFLTTDIKC